MGLSALCRESRGLRFNLEVIFCVLIAVYKFLGQE
jgi:hypothetical protein